MNSQRTITMHAFLLLAAMTGACDSAEAPQPSEETLRMCQYDDFSVELTDGPNAGLRLAGTMFFIRDQPDTRIGGHLKTTDGEIVPIAATVNDRQDIALTFHTKVGYVMGLGHMEGDLCAADDIEGAAIGPEIDAANDITASDRGHWLLAKPQMVDQLPDGTFNYPGDTTNQDGTFTTNVTASTCMSSGGVVELRCGLFCLYTYEACRGGDRNGEVIINGSQS